MIETIKDYEKMPKALTPAQMAEIHAKMQKEIGEDPEALEIYNDLLDAASKYAEIRSAWSTLDSDEKHNADPLRTNRHNGVILHLNMLARYLRSKGCSASWREDISAEPETEKYSRKVLGDFGCYIAFVAGLCAR